MKKRIANWLGLPTQEEINDIKNLVMASEVITNSTMSEVTDLKERFLELKRDMSALYSEVSSDIKRVDKKIMAVKPILKVQDEEAVKFIKGILSKHDNKMNNQENQLYNEMQALIDLKGRVEDTEYTVKQASEKIKNVILGLGLAEEIELTNVEPRHIKDMLAEALIRGKENQESKGA